MNLRHHPAVREVNWDVQSDRYRIRHLLNNDCDAFVFSVPTLTRSSLYLLHDRSTQLFDRLLVFDCSWSNHGSSYVEYNWSTVATTNKILDSAFSSSIFRCLHSRCSVFGLGYCRNCVTHAFCSLSGRLFHFIGLFRYHRWGSCIGKCSLSWWVGTHLGVLFHFIYLYMVGTGSKPRSARFSSVP